MKRYLPAAGWALGMLVLILDGKTVMDSAAAGVALCIGTLIPNLFPFFVLSAMLTSALSGGALLLTGILGGYPVGAANTARAFRAGQLTQEEAERMAVLCNCAGPSFIFGVAAPILGSLKAGLAVWGVYLMSVLVLWLIFPKSGTVRGFSRPMALQQALSESIRAMAGVCGWVVLFRVVLGIMDRWVLWLLPDWGRGAFFGLMELSNGCLALAPLDRDTGMVLAAGFVGFGGLCVMLQTASVAQGLTLRLYFPGKLFQSCLCMLLASFLTPGTVAPLIQGLLALTCAACIPVLRKNEKRCGNRRPVIV